MTRPDIRTQPLGRPSDRSAVIVRTWLPRQLDALRRRAILDADKGIPAHLTLLYPFISPERLDESVRSVVAEIARSHPSFDFNLTGAHTWPGTVYAAVAPTEPFARPQADLSGAFPAFPIYGQPPGFIFVPHVSVAEASDYDLAEAVEDPAWKGLPSARRATAIEVIVSDGAGWRTRWRLRLGQGKDR